MSSAKHTEAGGLLAKVETTYGTDAAPAATDAIRYIKPAPEMAIRYGFDGSRMGQNGGFGPVLRLAPNARNSTLSIRCEGKGKGAAYTSSAVEVPDVHRLLRSCGLDATVSTAGGSEKWDFTPTATTTAPGSTTIWGYSAGELWKHTGCYGNVKISSEGTGIPVWQFDMAGIMSAVVTDIALPALTYTAGTVLPPPATGITFVLGNLTAAKVRSFTFDLGRTFDQPRLDLNSSAGHAGFSPGPRDPSLEVVIEATALTTTPFHATSAIDPYQIVTGGISGLACSLVVGSTQYNRWKLVFAQTQVMVSERLFENNASLYRLVIKPYATSEQAVDDLTIRFD
jgi:hypothetical protein